MRFSSGRDTRFASRDSETADRSRLHFFLEKCTAREERKQAFSFSLTARIYSHNLRSKVADLISGKIVRDRRDDSLEVSRMSERL